MSEEYGQDLSERLSARQGDRKKIDNAPQRYERKMRAPRSMRRSKRTKARR